VRPIIILGPSQLTSFQWLEHSIIFFVHYVLKKNILWGTYHPISAPESMTKENPELDSQLILCTTTTLGTTKYYCSSEDAINLALVFIGLESGRWLLIGGCC